MKTNHYLTLTAVVAVGLASCTSEDLVNEIAPTEKTNVQTVMSFDVHTKNMTRTEIPVGALQNYKKEFGVWTYKTNSGTETPIMENFLVGYYNSNGGYYAPSDNPTLWDGTGENPDGKSFWFYQGLGSTEYNKDDVVTNYNSEHSTSFKTTSDAIMDVQNLKYWDASSDQYDFYAYIPYDKNASFNDKKLTFSLYTASANTDETGENTNLVAKTIVEKGSGYTYADVPLTFKRLNGKVRVAFWEELGPGYKVAITSAVTATPKDPVNPATAPATYNNGLIAVKGTPVYDFANGQGAWTYENASDQDNYSYSGDALSFAQPTGTATTITNQSSGTTTSYNVIASTKNDALAAASTSISATNYYCVPANTVTEYKNSGLMFKFSFKTIATDTGETSTYTDKEVFVPDTYNQWVGNTVYTYVFKITGQKPIVFDGIVISDYSEQVVDADVNVSY